MVNDMQPIFKDIAEAVEWIASSKLFGFFQKSKPETLGPKEVNDLIKQNEYAKYDKNASILQKIGDAVSFGAVREETVKATIKEREEKFQNAKTFRPVMPKEFFPQPAVKTPEMTPPGDVGAGAGAGNESVYNIIFKGDLGNYVEHRVEKNLRNGGG